MDHVSLDIPAGKVFALVGESGSGKSSIGRAIAGLNNAATGSIRFDGTDVTHARGPELRSFRRSVQFVFQDPFGSLDPRMSVEDIIAEPLVVHRLERGAARNRRITELLDQCGLGRSWLDRKPHELSGGQRQRVGIARALAVRPRFLVCDEPVSALDASVQAQILNLLMDLREEMGLTYLFIAHDLGVIRHISDQVAIMYLGTIVEQGPRTEVFADPKHPYTSALLSSAPIPDPPLERRMKESRIVLQGEIPAADSPPTGCRFHTRCWLYQDLDRPAACVTQVPNTRPVSDDRESACHFAEPDRMLPTPVVITEAQSEETR
ncbi:MAG: ATP-binding cassette domain-containing protein [Nocardioides sp.]|uniref:ABC transporter ATP-binding protein n=1 Tax=Nocardioides sp. TaxID=35761 RepID=UPI0039E6765E